MSNKELNTQDNTSKLNLLTGFYSLLGGVTLIIPILSIFGLQIPKVFGKEIDPTVFLTISLGIFFIALTTFIGIIKEDREIRFETTELIKNNLDKLDRKIHNLETLQKRDYIDTIKELIKNAKDGIQNSKNNIRENEIFLVMRTGKILEDCKSDFEKAIIAGCNLKVILLDKEYFFGHPSLLRRIVQEGEGLTNIIESINIVKGKFRVGDSAAKHLKNISRSTEARGSFEVRLSREYITSQLICLTNIVESTGSFFRVSLFYGINPRQTENTLVSKKHKEDLFEEYKTKIIDLWNYVGTSKHFDKYLPEERVLLSVEAICRKKGEKLVVSLSEYEINCMYQIFRQYGFVIIRPKIPYENYIEELLAIKPFFGEEIFPRHERANYQGITEISYNPDLPEHYIGTKNKKTGLHTDCTYSDDPPKVVIHQCVKPSDQGGESLLFSCKNAYNKMIEKSPETVATLTCPGDVFKIKRGNLESQKPIFCECGDQRFEAYFRSEYASIEYLSSERKQAFMKFKELLVEEYDNDNIFRFKLKSHDILIIDNTSVLHGRDEFPEDSDRKLYRLLLDGNIEDRDLLHLGFHVRV